MEFQIPISPNTSLDTLDIRITTLEYALNLVVSELNSIHPNWNERVEGMCELASLDDFYDPHDDLPTNYREAAEQIGKVAEWLAQLGRQHGLAELTELIELARQEAGRQAELKRMVN